MAVATLVEIDGPRNTVTKTTGDFAMNAGPPLVANTVIVNPATLTDMNPGMSGAHLAQVVRIDQIDYSISDNVTVQLFWGGSSPQLIAELYGRGKIEMKQYGGWQNPLTAGFDGTITMTVVAADGAGITGNGSLLINLWTVKYRPISLGGA